MTTFRIAIATILSLTGLEVGSAAEINVEQGRRLARELCAGCHSVERSGDSPLMIAPPFRELGVPASRLAETLRQGFPDAHQSMPRFRLDADQIENLVAYIQTLR